tara:strand:- start:287 stop:541 length:255 start_codon:yes stop_codon:yes gene_type:complete
MKRTRISPALDQSTQLTKEQRQASENKIYSESRKARGLGDTIERFTRATGIKKAVDTLAKATGKDCGCGARKDTLNKMFPYENK